MANLALLRRRSAAAVTPEVRLAPDRAEGEPQLIGASREELATHLAAIGVPEAQIKMRVAQLWHWLYTRGADDFAAMTNIAAPVRTALGERIAIGSAEMVDEQISTDGTRKWLLRFPARGPGAPVEVETVYIPEANRGTLCVSSQVGCTLNCTFCHTGTQRLVRNLTAHEIVEQVVFARRRLNDFSADGRAEGGPMTGRMISNIVLMGMGEPLYNFDNVKAAMAVASDGDGLSLSKRRITLSTSGVVPMIERVGREMGVMLAISLHAVRDDIRDVLVPLNKKYPIEALIEACRTYPGLSNARRITFEYVMLKGVNDSLTDARALVDLIRGIPAKINLIPFNAWPGSPYECSDWETIEAFADIVNRAGYASPVRTPRGQDILAACGQLRSESKKLSARERRAATEPA
ncbi:23S rRNA (adenine(2503)-C(2))-methyltransferase RlmN [Acuticoccus kandeliae]|uniref:23S rRNA (adenine(2503)-C(2))-methyltransferase RlmN n=1 Tax=Acuticoccus kandeliae TaxID=2073160 RepID=UPI000D3E8FF0|nr:23S rRNA (adenine(2503)-C(2))-methyltransferase RlmN [Acuticoccus kandeliae]